MFVACGIWCLADVSSISPLSEQTAPYWGGICSDEGLTLETSAKHHIPQATNTPYPTGDKHTISHRRQTHHIPQATNTPYPTGDKHTISHRRQPHHIPQATNTPYPTGNKHTISHRRQTHHIPQATNTPYPTGDKHTISHRRQTHHIPQASLQTGWENLLVFHFRKLAMYSI